ncbi:MAG: hypothetical protein Q9157_005489 [Trypethelium eluteriae]
MRNDPRNLEELFHQQYFSDHLGPAFSAESLQQTFNLQGKRLLFILDGLDEVHDALDMQSGMRRILEGLLSQPNIIVTSRPHTSLRLTSNLDLELETIGFFPEQVEEYLQGQQTSEKTLSDIRDLTKRNSSVQSLAQIPIQLDAICYAWSAKRFQDGHVTMSLLYWAILGQLCEKDIPKLSKKNSNGETITQQQLQGYPTNDLLSVIDAEFSLLGKLAFDGLRNEIYEFDMDQISRVNLDGLKMSDGTLLHMSFLRSSDNSVHPRDRTYHFLHLTYQEFFAAKYFVDQWKAPARQVSIIKMEPEDFLRNEKYNIRYGIFWRFVVGLLRINAPDLLDEFFEVLGGEPLDMLGPTHQRLTIHCLSEVFDRKELNLTFRSKVQKLEEQYLEWTRFEARFNNSTYLMREIECPDWIVESWLEGTNIQKSQVLSVLRDRPSISPEILKLVKEMLGSNDEYVWNAASGILGSRYTQISGENLLDLIPREYISVLLRSKSAFKERRQLSVSAINHLIQLLQDEDRDVQRLAAEILYFNTTECNATDLPVPTIERLIQLLQDQNRNVPPLPHIAATILRSNITNLPVPTVEHLIQLLQDQNSNVQDDAAMALCHNTNIPSVFELLIRLLKHKEPKLQNAAIQALHEQHNIPVSAFEGLSKLLQDKNLDVQVAAAKALNVRTNLPVPVVKALTQMLQHEESELHYAATIALHRQTDLPVSAVERLISLIQDEKSHIRCAASDMVRVQTNLTESALKRLIRLLQDENSNVQNAAAKALCRSSNYTEVDIVFPLLRHKEPKLQQCFSDIINGRTSLPVEAVEALISLLQHKEPELRYAATFTLWKRTNPSVPMVQRLTQLLQDGDPDTQRRAAEVLGQQINLPESAVEALISLLESKNYDVINCVSRALGVQTELPRSGVERLTQLLKHEQIWTQRGAIQALGGQRNLSIATVETLTRSLHHKESNLRPDFVNALGGQNHLSAPVVETLIPLLEDENYAVQDAVAKVLSRQSKLSETVVRILISLFQHERCRVLEDVFRALADREEFYSLIPTLDPRQLHGVLMVWIKMGFSNCLTCFIWEDSLHFNTGGKLKPRTQKLERVEESRRRWSLAQRQ